MNLRTIAPLALIAVLGACSGGGGSVVAPSTAGQTANLTGASSQIAIGTVTIGVPQTGTSSNLRKAKYVSPSTSYATLWIDSNVSGTRVPCVGSAGSCTINWVSTSGSHTFAVAVDDSSSIAGGGNVLAINSETVNLAAAPQSNALGMTLNGVPAILIYETGTVYNVGDPNCGGELIVNCIVGTYGVADVDGNLIVGTGAFSGVGLYPSAGYQQSSVVCWITNVAASECGITSPDSVGNDYPYEIECNFPNQTGTVIVTQFLNNQGVGNVIASGQLANYSLNVPEFNESLNWPTIACTNAVIAIVGPANGSITVQSHSNRR